MIIAFAISFIIGVGAFLMREIEKKKQYVIKCQYGIVEPEGFTTLDDYKDPDSELSRLYIKRLESVPADVLDRIQSIENNMHIHLIASVALFVFAFLMLIIAIFLYK